jgi:hypothetical protein
MNYRQFVKENFHKLGDMPAKDKMRKIGQMWRESGHSTTSATKSNTKSKTKGGSIISDLLDPVKLLGLGVKLKPKPKPKRKGGAVVGGSFLDRLLDPSRLLGFGLAMPDKTLLKHYHKMTNLQNKLNTNGKLTQAEHNKLKTYHHLHGAGFFDKILSGVKKGVNFAVDNLDTIKKVVPEIVKHAPTVLQAVGMKK